MNYGTVCNHQDCTERFIGLQKKTNFKHFFKKISLTAFIYTINHDKTVQAVLYMDHDTTGNCTYGIYIIYMTEMHGKTLNDTWDDNYCKFATLM